MACFGVIFFANIEGGGNSLVYFQGKFVSRTDFFALVLRPDASAPVVVKNASRRIALPPRRYFSDNPMS